MTLGSILIVPLQSNNVTRHPYKVKYMHKYPRYKAHSRLFDQKEDIVSHTSHIYAKRVIVTSDIFSNITQHNTG